MMAGRPHVEHDTVAYVMDHYVMGVDDAHGRIAGYLTVYDLGWMPEVGIGTLALARLQLRGGVMIDLAGAPEIDLVRRMQQRLRGIFEPDDADSDRRDVAAVPVRQRDPGYDLDLSVAPLEMTLERRSESDGSVGWRLEAERVTVEAWWRDPAPPLTVAAPVGVLHPERSVATVMLSYSSVGLVVDGVPLEVRPRVHAWWSEQLGRPFSSAHVALGETVSRATA